MVEVAKNTIGNFGTSEMAMIFDKTAQLSNFARFGDFPTLDHFHVDFCRERMSCIQHVCDSAAHSCSKVAPSSAKNDDSPTRHVLAPVITSSLNNSVSSRIPHSETLRGNTTNKRFTRGGTIKADISDDDVLFCLELGLARRINDEPTS